MSVRHEKKRGFRPACLIFNCGCGETRLNVRWRGSTPPGGVFCPTRQHLLGFNGSITLYPKG